ncbi:MAG: hypothetical protein VB078_08415 [Clostridiaceae bacterium]|nr:hypothetical protein [Clostridiaceae bacterium]
MKNYKHGKRVFSVAIALALVFSLSIKALADEIVSSGMPTVIFTSDREFTFSDDDDLFDNFKNMVPGDTVTQQIRVTSQASGKYDIYLYAQVPNSPGEVTPMRLYNINVTELLDYITVTDKNGNVLELRSAGAGTDGVKIGRFSSGTEDVLTVTVELPVSLGNEYQDAKAYINWIFYAQEYIESEPDPDPDPDPEPNPDPEPEPEPEPDPEPPIDIDEPDVPGDEIPPIEDIEEPAVPLDELPETGDNSGLIVPAIIMVLSGSALASVLLFAPRKEKELSQTK